MPPKAAKDCFVILYDANTSNKDALHALLKISYLKLLTRSKDMAKFVVTNVNHTDNKLNHKNISELKINEFTPERILECIEEYEPDKANWLEALEVCMEYLKEQFEIASIVTLQLLFLTDLSLPTNVDKNKLNEIICCLNEYNIFLYIVGPEIKPTQTIMSEEDVKKWMKNVVFDKKNENFSIVKKIVQETQHSVICNYKIGLNLFFSYKNWKGGQPWQVALSFGSKLQLQASTGRILKEGPPFKLQPLIKPAQFSKWVFADDETVEVDFHDIVAGISRHGKFVEMTSNEMFKVNGPRSFAVLGFTESCNIPEYIMQSDACYYVLPDIAKSEEAAEALYILIDKLAEESKYAIARRVYNSNNVPKFVVLIPRPDKTPKCFLMTELPYADDVKCDYVEMDPNKALKVEKSQEIYAYLDSLDVHKETCQVDVPLGPCMLFEPVCLSAVNVLAKKCLEKDLETLDIDHLQNGSNHFVGAVKNVWPVREPFKAKEEDPEDDLDDEFDNFANASFDF